MATFFTLLWRKVDCLFGSHLSWLTTPTKSIFPVKLPCRLRNFHYVRWLHSNSNEVTPWVQERTPSLLCFNGHSTSYAEYFTFECLNNNKLLCSPKDPLQLVTCCFPIKHTYFWVQRVTQCICTCTIADLIVSVDCGLPHWGRIHYTPITNYSKCSFKVLLTPNFYYCISRRQKKDSLREEWFGWLTGWLTSSNKSALCLCVCLPLILSLSHLLPLPGSPWLSFLPNYLH